MRWSTVVPPPPMVMKIGTKDPFLTKNDIISGISRLRGGYGIKTIVSINVAAGGVQ